MEAREISGWSSIRTHSVERCKLADTTRPRSTSIRMRQKTQTGKRILRFQHRYGGDYPGGWLGLHALWVASRTIRDIDLNDAELGETDPAHLLNLRRNQKNLLEILIRNLSSPDYGDSEARDIIRSSQAETDPSLHSFAPTWHTASLDTPTCFLNDGTCFTTRAAGSCCSCRRPLPPWSSGRLLLLRLWSLRLLWPPLRWRSLRLWPPSLRVDGADAHEAYGVDYRTGYDADTVPDSRATPPMALWPMAIGPTSKPHLFINSISDSFLRVVAACLSRTPHPKARHCCRPYGPAVVSCDGPCDSRTDWRVYEIRHYHRGSRVGGLRTGKPAVGNPSRSVLLLEAGPDYLSEHLPAELKYDMNQSASLEGGLHNWSLRARATPEQGRSVHFPRGRVTGGSSAINHQILLRGLPEDFDGWAAKGNDEWGYLKTLPYFRKLESDGDIRDDFHGTDGPYRYGGIHGRIGCRCRRLSTKHVWMPVSRTTGI